MTVRDIALDVNGDLSVSNGALQMVSDEAAIVQAIRIRMQFFKGEWFLDLDAGIPFFQSVLVKNPDNATLDYVFRKALLETPGVLSVLSLSARVDRSIRRLFVSYRVDTSLGEIQAAFSL